MELVVLLNVLMENGKIVILIFVMLVKMVALLVLDQVLICAKLVGIPLPLKHGTNILGQIRVLLLVLMVSSSMQITSMSANHAVQTVLPVL